MFNTHHSTRFVPTALALALAVAGNAQISNVGSDLVYNNVERGWDTSATIFGSQQQFVIAPNPPTTDLISPLADYTFTNPGTGGSAELKASSEAASSFSSTSSTAMLTASGFASSEAISTDTTSNWQTSASGGVDFYLDLATSAKVTFSVNSFDVTSQFAGCQFGANNIYVGDFLTSGDQTASTIVGPGSYDMFMFFFTNQGFSLQAAGDASSYSGGNYSISVQAVPEPSSMAVFGIGALGLLGFRRKKA